MPGLPLHFFNLLSSAAFMQMTPEFVLRYLGVSQAAEHVRRAAGLRAKRLMQTKFKCEDMADFQNSITMLLQAAYPPWYKLLFVNGTLLDSW